MHVAILSRVWLSWMDGMAGDIAHTTAHAFAKIGSGVAKAFDIKDASVTPMKPVKILTHV